MTIGSVSAALIMSGCSDFLEVTKYGASTTWETKDDVDRAVAALWSNVSNDSEGVTGRGIMWFECCSDNITVGRPQGEANQIRDFKMSPSNGRDVKDTWGAMYQINAKANNIIKVVPTMKNLDKKYIDQTVGTAYFWRGLSMLWIAPYYGDNGPNGGIPIILDTTEPVDMDAPRPASVIMNYDQIIKDMDKAAELLPYFSQIPENEYGKPHKAACWAFAARAALYASQWNKDYYKKVSEYCDKVMSITGADKRELYTAGSNPFADLWTKANNFSSEYLFSLSSAMPSTDLNSMACLSIRTDGVFTTHGDISSLPMAFGLLMTKRTSAATQQFCILVSISDSWAKISSSVDITILSMLPFLLKPALHSENSCLLGERLTVKARKSIQMETMLPILSECA